MEESFNFSLNASKTISKSFINLGLSDYLSVCNYIKKLPYGRNIDRSDYTSIIKENKGTCSTKHAFLKQLAIENNASHIQFCLGIYKMNEINTKGIGKVLSKYNIDYIPEAHTYLKYKDEIFDFTRNEISETSFYDSILFEENILPEQIGNYKLNVHKNFLKTWITSKNIPYSFEEIWKIREACIVALAK